MENKILINRVLTGCFLSLITILCLNILIRLRKRLPARVNCWFCDVNDWVPYSLRNSFFCKGCHQYNGFTSDGDYNVALDVSSSKCNISSCVRKSLPPSDNGLCYRCNTNQQLKIIQLANFQPLNEKNFELEVDAFRLHLESVYPLCSHCRRLVKQKLVTEKRHFLGAKLLLSRQNNDNASKNDKIMMSFNLFKIFLYKLLRFVAVVYMVYVLTDCYLNLNVYISKKTIAAAQKYLKNYYDSFNNSTAEVRNVTKAVKSETLTAYYYNLIPAFIFKLEIPFFDYLNLEALHFEFFSNYLSELPEVKLCIEILSILGFFLQFILQIFEFKISFRYFINDVAWVMLVALTRFNIKYIHVIQIFIGTVIMFYPIKRKTSVKHIKNIVSKKMQMTDSHSFNHQDNDDQLTDDSDVDLAFNKTSTPEGNQRPIGFIDFPMHYRNVEDSRSMFSNSVCNNSQYNNSMSYGFRNEDAYFSKPFARLPDFNMMQKRHYDTDSHLNKGIGSLTLGKQSLTKRGNNVFSTRQYDCPNPFMFGVSPPSSPRPVLSPSRLSPTGPQSWVAGGYWANDNSQQPYDLHSASRSSSQSSGFESQASSAYQRNVNSPSTFRTESVFNESNSRRKCDSFNGMSKTNYNQSYSPPNSPIYPNIQSKESSFTAYQSPWSPSTLQGFNASLFQGSERSLAPSIRSNANESF